MNMYSIFLTNRLDHSIWRCATIKTLTYLRYSNCFRRPTRNDRWPPLNATCNLRAVTRFSNSESLDLTIQLVTFSCYSITNWYDSWLSAGETCNATLNLVDLAGSERLKESGAEGTRLTETQHINTALSNLQNVIRAQRQKVNISCLSSNDRYLLSNVSGVWTIVMMTDILEWTFYSIRISDGTRAVQEQQVDARASRRAGSRQFEDSDDRQRVAALRQRRGNASLTRIRRSGSLLFSLSSYHFISFLSMRRFTEMRSDKILLFL